MTVFWFKLQYQNPAEDNGISLREISIGKYVASFFRGTSLQGIPKILTEAGILRKLFWIICCAGVAFLLQWELALFFSKFLSWKATTSFEIINSRQMDFPAVSICNNNPITKDWYETFVKNLKVRKSSSTGNTSTAATSQPGKEKWAQTKIRKEAKRATLVEFIELMEAAGQMPLFNRSVAGHNLCDVILDCSYNGVECGIENFDVSFWSPNYGSCWIFNAGFRTTNSQLSGQSSFTSKNLNGRNLWKVKVGDNNAGVRKATQPSSSYGLYLLLNADTGNYAPSTDQQGWHVVIHNQTVMPFPDTSGFKVMPGTATYAAIQMNYIERLGVQDNLIYQANYSNCVSDYGFQEDDERNAYSNVLEVGYSQEACLRTCYQLNVMRTCQCYDMNYPNHGKAFSSVPNVENLSQCFYADEVLWSCKSTVWQNFVDNKISCYCPDSCIKYNYDASISLLKWPSIAKLSTQGVCGEVAGLVRSVAKDPRCSSSFIARETAKRRSHISKSLNTLSQCGSARPTVDTLTAAQEILDKSYAQLYVYFRDFKYQSIIEKQLVELGDLIAYLGGIVGLFFGITMFTLCEYMLLIIDLVIIAIAKLVFLVSRSKTPKVIPSQQAGQYNHPRHPIPLRPLQPQTPVPVKYSHETGMPANFDYALLRSKLSKAGDTSI